MVLSLHAEGSGGVAAVDIFPWHKHVTSGAVGVGAVPLLHNHYRGLHVAVQEVNPEVYMRIHMPLAALHWAPNGPSFSREVEPI